MEWNGGSFGCVVSAALLSSSGGREYDSVRIGIGTPYLRGDWSCVGYVPIVGRGGHDVFGMLIMGAVLLFFLGESNTLQLVAMGGMDVGSRGRFENSNPKGTDPPSLTVRSRSSLVFWRIICSVMNGEFVKR